MKVKDEMGVSNIRKREEELVKIAFSELNKIPNIHILADNIKNRLGIISFYIVDIHFNLIVKILNDRFGIQVRGGCACAGTYGHFLLDVSHDKSKSITNLINSGDLSTKPGWVRLSLHPTMTNKELYTFVDALNQLVENIELWEKDYIYDNKSNEFRHVKEAEDKTVIIKNWFEF